MRNVALGLFIFLASAIHSSFAQSRYIVLKDSSGNEGEIFKGVIEKNDLVGDTSFHWYAESQRIYPRPDTAAVAAFKNNIDKIYFIIFGGTWCEDTHFVLPKFFRIQEAAAFPESRITLFGVDRNKTTTGNIAEAMNIINVPTIIVMKDGKELGRVVEYGKTGKWEQELADIINK
jgi:thiol-disulfide isomerase/thioredoxin